MKKKKILVVDDEPMYIEMARIVLKQADYEVISCGDGPTGVKKARDERPDLILLDITMPVMDGIQVCEALKLNDKTAKIPVIMCTARSDADAWVKSYDKGAGSYVRKPYEPGKLIECVERVLKKAEEEN